MWGIHKLSTLSAFLFLAACAGDGNSTNVGLASASCTTLKLAFTPAFFELAGEGETLDVNLQTGNVTYSGLAVTCDYSISAVEAQGFQSRLEGIAQCGTNLSAPIVTLSILSAANQGYSISQPSPETVTMTGGWNQFASDLESFKNEIKAQGDCTGNAN